MHKVLNENSVRGSVEIIERSGRTRPVSEMGDPVLAKSVKKKRGGGGKVDDRLFFFRFHQPFLIHLYVS